MSPSATDLAKRRSAHIQRLARHAGDAADRAWRAVDPSRITLSWLVQMPKAYEALTVAQQLAAEGADAYLDAALAAQGIELAPAGAVRPARLVGVASDGRSLDGLLRQSAITALQGIGQGAGIARSMAAARLQLSMIVRSQVADAGRVATGVGLATRGAGYVRQLSGGSCSRCVVLAGRFYRWSQGFQRHPRCDCVHVPAMPGRSAATRFNSRDYFNNLSAAEQARVFGRAGAEAIRDGADLNQVVNARRGMTAAGTTRESTSRRGVARPGRLMPEEIYRRSGGNRDEAVRLLRENGYIQ